ncbi:hypothetical protein LINPERHAP2_LOCUS41866 [Linum perenne]
MILKYSGFGSVRP